VLIACLIVAIPVGWYVFICLAWLRRSLLYPAPPSSWGAMLGLVAREVVAQLKIVAWTLTRRSSTLTPLTDGVPVVLLHGLMADGNSMWHLRRSLHEVGRPTLAPHLGGMLRPLTSYAARLTKVLEQSASVDIVCHSLGGIVLRVCLAAHPELAARVRRVITIASPHEGTLAALLVPIPEAKSVLPGGDYLRALPSLRTLLPQAQITTIASRHDFVVYPHETSRVDGGDAHEFDLIGHAELLIDPRVTGIVVEALR
jgi:triacylglycerol lipase